VHAGVVPNARYRENGAVKSIPIDVE